ncbi:hypothetical protein SESBI_40009, partial [Sesbania bispinosa]
MAGVFDLSKDVYPGRRNWRMRFWIISLVVLSVIFRALFVMVRVFDLIKDVYSRRQTWRLKVRIVTMWDMCLFELPTQPYAIEMVLMNVVLKISLCSYDGDSIQATIRKPMSRKFKNVVLE